MKNPTFRSMFKEFNKKFKQLRLLAADSNLKEPYKELEKAYKKLLEHQNILEKKVQYEIKKRLQQEIMLLDKSRFVTMGEMMDAVAHQWIQPMTLISMYTDDLKNDLKNEKIDKEYFIKRLESIEEQRDFMDSTLREFRDFLVPVQEESSFELSKAVKKSLKLIQDDLDINNIDVTFKKSDETKITGNLNEIQHVVINILNNAKDAFKTRNIQDPYIKISTKQKESSVMLYIEDNAGGIDELMLDRIFHPYVTTKKSSNSSGIGLYLCQLIMHKHHADISVKNYKDGARFTLNFPIYSATI